MDFKKGLAFLLASLMVFSLFAACNPNTTPESSSGEESSLEETASQNETSETSKEETNESFSASESSSKEEGTSAKPEGSSSKPEGSSVKPENSSAKPEQSSAKPESSSSKPEISSQKPEISSLVKPEEPIVPGNKAYFYDIWEKELAYLASMQLDNGALPMTAAKNGNVTMNPYFADFAAMALLDAGKTYQAQVKKYIQWHMAHLNTAATDYNGVDGTIYDYTLVVDDGVVIKENININDQGKKQYDSTDSYAATFLEVCNKYVKATGDSALIKGYANEISRIISAMGATMDNDLTYAKPDYKVQYLMDNCEVYSGYLAAAELYETALSGVSGASAKAKEMRDTAKKVSDAIEDRMWNMVGKYYEPAVDRFGNSMYRFSWNNFYPSATAQLFPICFGLLSPDSARAQQLYRDFNAAFSTGEDKKTWEQISIPDAFFWGAIPHTAAMMGDKDRVTSYVTNYERAMKKHAYPLYNADIARVAMACYVMASQL